MFWVHEEERWFVEFDTERTYRIQEAEMKAENNLPNEHVQIVDRTAFSRGSKKNNNS